MLLVFVDVFVDDENKKVNNILIIFSSPDLKVSYCNRSLSQGFKVSYCNWSLSFVRPSVVRKFFSLKDISS